MAKHKHVINLSEVPLEKINAPEGSVFGGTRQRVGAHIGAQKLGYSFFYVPPGKAAFPYPYSYRQRRNDLHHRRRRAFCDSAKRNLPSRQGRSIACPAGAEYPHQLINTGTDELRYLVVSTMEFPDLCEYPDSNKVGAYATAAVGLASGASRALYKRQNVNYYDGEDGKEIERIIKSASSS